MQDTGVVEMAVDEAHGGWGASDVDLALIAEHIGRAVAPAPVIEAQVAARLLAAVRRTARTRWRRRWRVTQLVTFVPRPAQVRELAWCPRVRSRTRWSPWSATRCCWCRWATTTHAGCENLASMPLADIEIRGSTSWFLPKEPGAHALHLGCTRPVAGADRLGAGRMPRRRPSRSALSTPSNAMRSGRAIGTFQAVSHPLADSATAADGARLLGSRPRVRSPTNPRAPVNSRRWRSPSPTRRHAMRPNAACTSTAATASGWSRTFSSTTAGARMGDGVRRAERRSSTGSPTCATAPSQVDVGLTDQFSEVGAHDSLGGLTGEIA